MQIVDLLATFSNPETFDSLTTTQRLMAGLVTTLLGMGITFVALVTLMVITSFMDKLGGNKIGGEKQTAAVAPRPAKAATAGGQKTLSRPASDDEEIAVAITTALAIMLETSHSNFMVKTIRRVEDSSTSWSRAGLADQLQRKF
jgi:sodium pump decarboxylase gamma subunit